ncbi:hypothetical protein [Bradyrhizobium sp.]|uniref:hypothetical protein n=1 Tax=Bradyrhizobium sp. TaxID=376 RepID=UPI003C77FE5C
MTKTLSAIAILSAAIASPVFAQDAGVLKPIHHGRAYDQRHFRGAYNQLNGPLYAAPRTLDRSDTNGFGFGGRNLSWVGGEDPPLNPSGS